METLYNIFSRNDFQLTKETTKASEFESLKTKEVVYLLPSQQISIVLHPNTVDNHLSLKDKKYNRYHNTALKQFPKRKNNGQQPIHYGYSFVFKTEGELESFLSNLNLT
jgi:hypothetical protein